MKYDVVVIGGGPAGMISAGRAGEMGARVLLLEKNENLGAKLLITGKGRCNITNASDESRELVGRFGKNGSFLFSVLSVFGVEEVISFFEERGVKTKIEADGRVFPLSDKSRDVLSVLLEYMKKSGVVVKNNSEVKNIVYEGGEIKKIITSSSEEISAGKFIICTGGKSYPEIGSTGDGYEWLRKMGHTITKLSPSLTPVIVNESFIKKIEGVSLSDVGINLFKDGKKIDSRIGGAIFTSNGLSGPVIINMSKIISQELPAKMSLKIDLIPRLDSEKLDQILQKDFKENSNKMIKNSLNQLLPQKLMSVIIDESGINLEKKINSITKEERGKIVRLIKEFTLQVKGVVGYSKSVVTSGGVLLGEVDPKTMKSKIISNLHLAGEILDLDGPTGGYNLQVCWSSGYVAGESVA